MDAAKNFAKGTVDGAYDDEVTSIDLIAGDGNKFPAAPFNAVWWNATDYPDPADDPLVEIIRVTAKSTDTLTIQRGHEGTGVPGVAGVTHNTEGKVYKLIAPLTAKFVDEVLPATHAGDDYTVDVGGLTLSSGDALTINAVSTLLLSRGTVLRLTGTTSSLGDEEENNNGTALLIDDDQQTIGLRGKLASNQTTTASVGVGTITRKLEIFDLTGSSLGFIPIYSSIT